MSETKPETPPNHDYGVATVADEAEKPSSPATASDHEIDSGTNSQHDETQKEIGGRAGPDPTRFGDWEKAGRCIDF